MLVNNLSPKEKNTILYDNDDDCVDDIEIFAICNQCASQQS